MKPQSLLQQLVLASILGVICIGQMAVILTGNIDLSVAWTMNLCSVIVTSVTMGENQRVAEAIALSLLAARCHRPVQWPGGCLSATAFNGFDAGRQTRCCRASRWS